MGIQLVWWKWLILLLHRCQLRILSPLKGDSLLLCFLDNILFLKGVHIVQTVYRKLVLIDLLSIHKVEILFHW